MRALGYKVLMQTGEICQENTRAATQARCSESVQQRRPRREGGKSVQTEGGRASSGHQDSSPLHT